MNLYAYVGGDPINWIDPWGLRQFGVRPLDGAIPPSPGINAMDDYINDINNVEPVHEQYWFDDAAQYPNAETNIGFFGDEGMWNEPGTVREDTTGVRL